MPVLIAMRCVQAIGSSAVVAVGAGSLADMFEVHERGKKVCFLLDLGARTHGRGSLGYSMGYLYWDRLSDHLSVEHLVM
jgi:MFS family permease